MRAFSIKLSLPQELKFNLLTTKRMSTRDAWVLKPESFATVYAGFAVLLWHIFYRIYFIIAKCIESCKMTATSKKSMKNRTKHLFAF